VTGAGSGLGRAFCLELAARHARILAVDIDAARAEETAALCKKAGGDVVSGACDVSKASEVEALAGRMDTTFGGTDLVINNAGVAAGGSVGVIPLADWEWVMGVNLWGVIYGCHTFVPRFKAQKSGHILNVASAAGLLSAPEMGPYNVTKSGVVALSETLAGELAGTGVGVTVLCPTFFLTNIARASRTSGAGAMPEQVEKLMGRTSVQAPEVAAIALDACSGDKLYALPHNDGRWMWRMKRLMPETFQKALVPRVVAIGRKRTKTK
jgi:NAD(P)-dependent dehydrogenase (short-subunit alcohol dehydrogenase family)